MKDVAEYGAFINLVVVLCLNFIVICGNFGINLLLIAPAKIFSLIFCGGLMVLFYYIYVKSKRYTRIIEKYKKETQRGKLIGNVIIVTYIILSIFCLLVF
jgi:arginine exporter protein ArgO